MVRDETVFLPIWLQYYSRCFASRDIYVYDHGSTDGSVAAARKRCAFQLSVVGHPVFNDFPWYTAFIQRAQRELLESYDVVVFAEADEILWHPSGLGRYLHAFERGADQRDAVRATGWSLWHDRTHEPDLDLSRSIVSQRRYLVRDLLYDKALITRVPLTYGFGFHWAKECRETDPELMLLHLHTMDYRLGLQKHERTRAYRDYSSRSIELNQGSGGRLVGDEYAAWFDRAGCEDRRRPIPPRLLEKRPV